MNILITGGAGFIGSSLSERLIADNNIICVDNFHKFYSETIKRKNIAELLNNNNYCLKEGDIRDKEFLAKIFDETKPDAVIHLAALAGVRPSIENPTDYYDVNVGGTLNILECMRDRNIKTLVLASSSSVYGNNKSVPFKETDSVDNPISPYAATKKADELLCYTFHHLYDINVACLRFFTVYGPRQRPDLAIHKFTKLISEGKEIPFFGDGQTRRDYTFITDILDGIVSALEWTMQGQKRFEVFNLGGSEPVTLSTMVAVIEAALGKKAVIKMLPSQQGDVECTYADLEKSKSVLNYSPKVDFSQGINEFVKWFKKENIAK